MKYGRLLEPGQRIEDVVYAEKLREDAIRAQQLGVTRWTWDTISDFAPMATHIRRTFAAR